MCAVRAYLRHRATLLDDRAAHILRMHKALHQMNIQLDQVLTDITGETGMAILRAIVAGERDGLTLAQRRDPHCKSSQETLAKALTGTWKPEYVFVLQQALALYDVYTQQIAACDAQLEQQYATMKPRWAAASDALPLAATAPKRGKKRKNKSSPPFDVEAVLIRLTGVDVAAVGGIGPVIAQTILSETGTDMSKWASDKHFASWLGLAPHNDISGGKVLRSRTLPTNNRAGQAFRQAAVAVARSPTDLGAYYRRKRSQGGPQFAQVATAHKIARIVYHLLKYRLPYVEMGAEEFARKQRQRDVAALRKKAAKLGFKLIQPDAVPAAA